MHAFCRDCLEAWLVVKPICPLCKVTAQQHSNRPVLLLTFAHTSSEICCGVHSFE